MDIREVNHHWYDRIDEDRMVIIVLGPEDESLEEDDNGNQFPEKEIPAKYEVCDVCGGKGSYVNPSIDSGGISAYEFADDPGFSEEYFSGMYDMTCDTCKGKRVVLVPNEELMSAEDKEYVRELERNHYAFEAERAAERRMGA